MKSKMKTTYLCVAVAFSVLYFDVAVASLTSGQRYRTDGSYKPGVLDSGRDGKHPCLRKCDGTPMTCEYQFDIEWYQSMSKACFDCPFNITDCERKDCVVGNGVSREITTINRMMPGPSIEVCHGDIIVVHVKNELMAAGTTIHWHGVHQIGTPYMDGVPFVTQCPITPETTFTYRFNATHAGTHFWHAHLGVQRGDGISGALIVRKPATKEPRPWGIGLLDLPEHVILLQDWTNATSLRMFTEHYHAGGDIIPSSLLVNGVGKFPVSKNGRTAMTKTPMFNVVKGKRYRFRVINAGFSFCPVEISVEKHDLKVVASDGWYIRPVTAKSVVLFAGERFDFILSANQDIDNYWFKIRSILYCKDEPSTRQAALLHYEGASDAEPSRPVIWEETGLQVNPVNQGEELTTDLPVSKLKYLGVRNDGTDKEIPDAKFYVAYDLYLKDNKHFNKPPGYGMAQVDEFYRAPIPQLNHISMLMPSSPILVTRPSADVFCNATEAQKNNNLNNPCKDTYCQCPHVLSVKLHDVVEVIIVDEGAYTDENHPLHLHGHSFRVIGMERLGNNTTLEDVMNRDKNGELRRNFDRPPIKDTVAVPDGGYTIIRFNASNPGYWLFHCHIEYHAEVGMAMVFKVGEHEDMPPVPENFPSCGNYVNNNGMEGGALNGGRNTNGQNGLGNNGRGNIVNGVSGLGSNGKNNVYAQVIKQFNAYHSVVEMPMGGEMEIVYRGNTDS